MTRETPRTDQERVTASAFYNAGLTIEDTANLMGISTARVDKLLLDWGVIRRCKRCTIILEANEIAFCRACEAKLDGRPPEVSPMTLESSEGPVNLAETFKYGRH